MLSLLGLINVAKIDTLELNSKTLDEYLDKIHFCAKKLDKTLCEILDYSKNARGELIFEKLDLTSIIEDEFQKHLYMENAISTKYQIENSQELEFISDKYRIIVIFANLISNAIKYQDSNKEINNTLVKGTINEKNADIQISDNGIGIDQAQFGNIFKMFYRASTLSVGSGLGLYLVKESIDKLDGKISVRSEPHKGTTFYLSIPNKILEKGKSQ